jgi:hypothetical protein
LIFSKQTPDLLAGIRRCLWTLGGLAETLVWDRQAGIHAYEGRPTQEFAAFCGQLRVGWHFCGKRDPQAKGVVERWQGYAETNFEPGRVFANELDFQGQFDAWSAKANARRHRTIRARPIDRLAEELAVMAALPQLAPDTDRRWVLPRALRPIPTFALTAATTRSPQISSVAASRSVSATANSPRRRWTLASWPAGTRGPSPCTGRSPRSSTPARSNAAGARPSRSLWFRRGRWMSMTG